MEINPSEVTKILKEQIKNFGDKAEVTEVGQVLSVGDGLVPRIILDDSGDTPQYALEAQDYFSIIELADGTIYQGEFVEIKDGNVYFKPEGSFGAQPIEIYNVIKLELYHGLVLIRDGKQSIFVDSDSPKSGSGFRLRNFGGLLIGVSGIMLLSINNRKISSDSTIEEIDDFIDKQKDDVNIGYLMLAFGGLIIALDNN